jgi:glycosyltransferase involved in cell wall biosynthesis
MRVIWVTPALPHPEAAGGWAHEFELIAAMAARHEVEVVSSDIAGPLDEQALLAAGAGFTRVGWNRRAHPRSSIGMLAKVPFARPNMTLWLRRDRIGQLAAAIDDLSARFKPDLVHITLGELAPLIAEVQTPTALLLFDALTREIESRLAIETRGRRRAQLLVERRRTVKFERDWYKRAGGVASVSAVDAAWFGELLGQPVPVIENPIADRFFEPPTVARTGNIVTFVGTLNHAPNTDAIEWLATAIWPHVLAQVPDAQLVVVGRGDRAGRITGALRSAVEAAGGRLDADVDDIRPYYWEAAAVAAPMRTGAGMRNKVIHAMACGAPVVATPAALEGVPEEAAVHALVGTTAEEVAAAIVTTLRDREGSAVRAKAAESGMDSLRTPVIADRFDAWWRSIART